MASKSFAIKYFVLLLVVALFFTTTIHAQDHIHEDGTVHNSTEVYDHDHDHNHTNTTVGATTEAHKHDHDHDHDHDHSHEVSSATNTTLVNQESESATAEHEHEHEHGHAHGISCDMEAESAYNMPMRIGSIFIILVTSAVGIFAPIALYRISPPKEGGIRDWILAAGKFFGTGVIISTAFIHMLPEALERFESECIGEGWHSYHAFGGLFCMLASFFLQLIELAAISNLDKMAANNIPVINDKDGHVVNEKMDKLGHYETGHVHSAGFLENEQSIRNIGTFILELGIVMHSIIIGITLGTISEGSFQTLLIALVFHQFFEGIALGTRINELQCNTWLKPTVMGLLFICMTPIGVAIGIGIRSSINPPAAILAQGILDSLSAGILLYNAYVSLMSMEINHNTSFRRSPLSRKIYCFICMYIGAALMSVLGTWA
ncbi:ZIP zinc transporter-domain-containing protein [Gilbertella persicaria]|uniref:ZIP zinc transporter-domain-containing protein n=1 Tax=Gilbertella persicaria TaxID=101096 RepID=UPI00221F8CBB|nr:ZIP zinc transporter-domain-containing protein [Gilbertella persicaria]KAI8084272.1 ZIP zinc transporter-domain-containing protein [Gilbertella persicaria]